MSGTATAAATYSVEAISGGYRLELGAVRIEALEITRTGRRVHVAVSVYDDGALAHRDRLDLASAAQRTRFVGKLNGASVVVTDKVLLALDEAIRQSPPPDTTAACTSALDLIERGDRTQPLHPAQDIVDGVLWYGCAVGGGVALITSERKGHNADEMPSGLSLRHTDPGPSALSRDALTEWLTGTGTGSIAGAIDGVAAFFRRYMVFRDPRDPDWLAAWTAATWCYRAFPYFAYVSVRSPGPRCGKTRLLGLLQRVSFNASPIMTYPTEAQLYREAYRTGGTQLLDEVETLRGDKEKFETLITVLNAGFQRGQTVPRLEKRGERYVSVHYDVYAPRVLAGIGALKDVLEDRTLPVFLLRRLLDEPVMRLTRTVTAEAQALRDRCGLACLTRIGDIVTAYDQAPALLEQQGVDDRAVDLWAPVVAVALVADAEDGGSRVHAVLAVAHDASRLRDAEADGGQAARLLDALDWVRQAHGEQMTPNDLLAALQTRPGWGFVKSTRRLAGLLNPLGLFREQVREGTRRSWYYTLKPTALADLRRRYTPQDSEPSPLVPVPSAQAISEPESARS
jgi:hypothetical protein